ncbi:hypothetical protein A2334_02650 [Candidatus Roizmanbacteria bacterium RIFOXYB2_FULL_38_10]|uniref:Nudix hydrolase domain-containing protein n=1 Tax=Candidatus Roizmanbacteria bacterium RIFOXYD1_FULL_38_12 TaxID=1802093 RepID=A0A1F7L0G1_9BACT|nr:MAG: hypothetical protein A3K47_02350 [Candidatus Roizmanbacteria bacterium RIFOXYA2_FULL_38_14]OGK63617.1 MAG: hypothetical protein A3K27_02350 [Candidatus Roizmanbacteria bacterium RIFOXYA1_FULL_37_12]OGK65463.1 MAG: hypothetical protein A3K38_02350 [Candidatus Roizmanbacteria bacterium RIFOXYB1_FULL_40_23]OGK69060.1 MAG: hypothetical protein A2334_02650 [Candidatus Roizmanbacteria bacterium RIFOXYB2_FULL_38_10]OGK69868.1 MAG: hypothetical protein A3K21_02355 [Candidatus Roizmanbacteria ba
MNKIVPVAIAVIHNKDRFLLTKRKEIDIEDKSFGHCWNFPGGGIEFGEDPITALKREVKEELQVEITIKDLIPRIFSPLRHTWHGLLICYICELTSLDKPIILNHEAMAFDWFTIEEIKNLKTLPLAYDIALEASKLLEVKRNKPLV